MAMQRLCVIGGGPYSVAAIAIGAALTGGFACGGDGSDDAVAFATCATATSSVDCRSPLLGLHAFEAAYKHVHVRGRRTFL
jgi:hypothetical protein